MVLLSYTKNGLILYLSMLFFMSLNAQEKNISIIPKPVSAVVNGEKFILKNTTTILYSEGLKSQAKLLQMALSPATGWDFAIKQSNKQEKGSIFLNRDTNKIKNKEAYELIVNNNGIQITANQDAGVFYGIQTLLQLLPETIYSNIRQKEKSWAITGVEIQDEPSYAWRGVMLDVSRYFFEKDYVLHFLDMMAMYKLNVLHLHLIDDAGWRLEIKKYPKLTSVGAWAGQGKERNGGYYTQEDIKEIVAYAALRNIEIIPEIEVPAHTLGAIAAYPYLSCEEKEVEVQTQHYISRDLYCVGKESTFEFLKDVFEETFELFPSNYIHIGGDEAKYDRWEKCPHCQKRKKEEGLSSEAELQVYFNRRIQKMVKKHDKTIVGWDEIIEDGLTEKAVGMVWYDQKKALSAVKAGHDVVMALTSHMYFDTPESNIPGEVKAATWLPPTSLKQVYTFNPMLDGIEQKYGNQVLGGHACLWSDQFIHGTILQRIAPINENRAEKYMDYLALPRMTALAETVWTPKEQQQWESYEGRMSSHYTRFDAAGYGYRMPVPKLISNNKKEDVFEIVLENMVDNTEIKYTTDGIRPNTYSTTYTGPVSLNRLENFQAITVKSRQQYSLPLYFPKDYSSLKKYGKVLREWKPHDLNEKEFKILDIDIRSEIVENRKYTLTFVYTDGLSDIIVESVEILKNGEKMLMIDKVEGPTEESDANVYSFLVDNYETGAVYTAKVKIKGKSSKDSYGAILIK